MFAQVAYQKPILKATKTTRFIPFTTLLKGIDLPLQFNLTQEQETPHPLCLIAAAELQQYLQNQTEWQHNFGLLKNTEAAIVGKMFGVLVVKNQANEIGYLAAFSGKLAGTNSHPNFVPPIFDLLAENGFLTKGMQTLSLINQQIKSLSKADEGTIAELKAKRKQHSIRLQHKIFDQYHFINKAGKAKSLINLFAEAGYNNPPAGAGECAAPKLLQYAFQHQLQPLALTEFWWGLSPKSATWQHKNFYACCKEKCQPILAHMLKDINCA